MFPQVHGGLVAALHTQDDTQFNKKTLNLNYKVEYNK